jgi:plasmid stabilization system protein ParE
LKPVRLSRLAAADIRSIGNDIAADKPRAAEAFVDQIIQRCHSIADAPEGYGFRPAFGAGVRGVPIKPYVILYRVREHDILILGVRHGARRPETVK